MKIVVTGGAGDVGSRVVKEAVSRGHDVVAVSRSGKSEDPVFQDVELIAADVSDAARIAEIAKDADLIVSALRPVEGNEEALLPMSRSILGVARDLDLPLIMVGGAARLKLSDDSEYTVLTAPDFLPDVVVPIAKACQEQYEMTAEENYAKLAYITPPAMLTPGERTGQYALGRDALVKDQDGNSAISMEDFAVAILDEAENPQHTGQAFTVAYQ